MILLSPIERKCGMAKGGPSNWTVGKMLEKCARFPRPGKKPKKVGERWYPRSSSDSVPSIVKMGVDALLKKLGEEELAETDPKAKFAALNRLVCEVWPKPHRGAETSKMQAAEYVRDWAAQHGININLPDKKEE